MATRLALLVAVAWAAASTPLAAQTDAGLAVISGVVVDPSGAALPGTVVSATDVGSGRTVSTATTGAGTFALTGLIIGRYTVRAELDGFAPWDSGILVVQPGSPTELRIPLGLAAYGDTVVVTGSRAEETIAASPVALTVIGADEVQRAGSTSYGDVLRQVPGVNVVQMSARDVNLSTRTATSRNARTTLVLLDGVPMQQDYFGMVLWDLLPVDASELKQIEVVRGPGSAVWGANALTGVINLITKSPRELDRTLVRLAAGGRSTREAGIVQAGVTGRLGYKVSGAFASQGAWPRPAALADGTPLPPYDSQGTTQYKADARVDFEAGAEQAWRLDAGYARSRGLLITGLGPYDADALNQGFARGQYRRGSITGGVSVSLHDAHYAGVLAADAVDITSQTVHAEVADKLVAGRRHLLVLGGVLRLSHFDISLVPDVHTRQEAGAFAEDDIFVANWMRLRAGARVDWFSTFGLTASPRLGVVVTPASGHAVRVAVNRSYLAPSLTENFLRFSSVTTVPLPTGPFPLPVQVLGNRNLDEETLNAIEVGYTGVFTRRVTVSASVYRNRTRGLINLAPVEFYTPASPPPGWPLPPETVAQLPLARTLSYVNVGRVRENGFELSGDVRLTPALSFSGNYSWQARPVASEEDGSPFGFPLNLPPRYRVNVEASYAGERFFGSIAHSWTGRAFWSDVLTYTGWTGAYRSLDASAGMPLPGKRGTVVLRGVNLADEPIQQHLFADILRRRVILELRLRR